MKIKVTVPHPHVKPHHVKHSAAFGILTGTLLEIAHYAYPSGLIMLAIAGCVAVYEPHLVTEVRLNEEEEPKS